MPMTIAECLRELLSQPTFGYQPLPPATAAALQQLAQEAGGFLPAELRGLYQLSNGIEELLCQEVGAEPLPVGHLLLPAEAAAAQNQQLRRQPQTPTEAALLVVAPTYTGGWFGYRRADLPAASRAIYAWLPVDDELVKVADSLPGFLLGWAEGRISV